MIKKKMCNSGFTLIEILIAVVVFSIVITILFSSFRAFMLSSNKVKEEITGSEKMTHVFDRINQDFQSIFIVQQPQYRPPEFDSSPDPHRLEGSQEYLAQGLVSLIVFSSFAHADTRGESLPGVARIAYYLKQREEDGLYDLYRADFMAPYPEENRSCLDPILCTGLSGFDILYSDENGDEYPVWNSDSKDYGFAYPVKIELSLSFGLNENKKAIAISVELQSQRPKIE